MLVVDDDRANRLLAVRWLERAGLATLEAESGAEALRILQGGPASIGAVFLDVMMPQMSGHEVLERMQADPLLCDIPVVISSAYFQQESDVLHGLRLGAADHIHKPFRGPILAAKLQRFVEQRRRQLQFDERLRRAEERATIDPLTGFGNLREFEAELRREAAFAVRHREPLALVLIDVDDLKVINDALGRHAGDRAIEWTADGLRTALRCSDKGFRVRGDELAVLLRGLDRSRGLRAARRIARLQAKRSLPLEDGDMIRVTVSVGVAAADAGNAYDVRDLYERAERALVAAKAQPGERVTLESADASRAVRTSSSG